MIGVLVNTITVILGAFIGLVFRSKIPQKVINAVMTAVGLCVVCIGISGTLDGQNTIVLIISMVLGTGVGALVDIDEKIISSTRIVYLEGYLCDDESACEAMIKAADLAHKHNRQVAFTLSDKSCVLRHREWFLKFITECVDILFANEVEIKTLFANDDFYKTLDAIKPLVEVAAITRSEKGSVVVNNRIKIFVEAEKVENAVDTTGAGDAYAAGFLYGLTTGRTLGTCALIGNIAASEIISHYGARAEVSLRGFVRNKLREYGKTLR